MGGACSGLGGFRRGVGGVGRAVGRACCQEVGRPCHRERVVLGQCRRGAEAVDAAFAGADKQLAVGDAFYRPEHSSFSTPLSPGTPVYVQVDAYDKDTTYGAVLESHEITGATYNNIGSSAVP